MASRVKKDIRKVKSLRVESTEMIANPGPVKEKHPVPSIATVKPYRRASFAPDKERANITKQDLRRLRDKHFILDDIRLIVPTLMR